MHRLGVNWDFANAEPPWNDHASTRGSAPATGCRFSTKEEILATLDANGRLDELPFMPEMLNIAARRCEVGKRAHKTCDPALGIGGRKMANTVHLENIRCNGAAHDGCEAGCLIFWKEAWLKPTRQAGEVEARNRQRTVRYKCRAHRRRLQCSETPSGGSR